ncbi:MULTISPECIES: hypothetical protein [unclassified Nocardioides]|uniref:hypothetical protein n=1 Tax=unclassified Nocardioides TaxID=2615069 RepID=UPI0006F8BBC7|nr:MULTISPECIES: hypothetical protein [unclassified Nocardioides]KRA39207.1 hypothetical protein ASD81_11845 [Nocardioides sp. Root614]KRA93166.1 hypothetical protein ASD84_12110 [Nocardioides sp. Root682]
MRQQTLHTATPVDRPEVRFGMAGGSLLVGAAMCTALPLSGWYGVVLLLAIAAAWCVVLPLGLAIGVGVSAWAFATGFAVNDFGVLTFAPADLLRLGLYAGVAVLVSGAQ